MRKVEDVPRGPRAGGFGGRVDQAKRVVSGNAACPLEKDKVLQPNTKFFQILLAAKRSQICLSMDFAMLFGLRATRIRPRFPRLPEAADPVATRAVGRGREVGLW